MNLIPEHQKSLKNFSSLFEKEGALNQAMPDFEFRPSQKEIAEKIYEAFIQEKGLLIEAGTGIGKSLAYLSAALLYLAEKGGKVVISTHTITLQEQLFYKEIPFALKALDLDLKPCLIKGMNNYVCLKKAEENTEINEEFEHWLRNTKNGDRSTFSQASHSFWKKVQAEKENCQRADCLHFKNCFFFKARRQAEEAQLIVVNHFVLLSDLQKRREEPETSFLPSYQHLIIDEAHHLEEVALEMLTQRFEPESVISLLNVLIQNISKPKGKLVDLAHKLEQCKIKSNLSINLEINYLLKKEKLQELISESFHGNQLPMNRLCQELNDDWKGFLSNLNHLKENLKEFLAEISSLLKEITHHKNPKLKNSLQPVETLLSYLTNFLRILSEFLEPSLSDRVRWLETTSPKKTLIQAHLNVSALLKEHLFEPQKTYVLCSATLCTQKNFNFLRKTLGIPEEAEELIHESTFDFEKQALLIIPKNENTSLFESILSIITLCQRGILILFTSYQILNECYDFLISRLNKEYELFKQNELSKKDLIEKFRKSKKGILLGTDTFWEGIDIPGEALRCVIMTKLPFKVPTEPLFEAMSKKIEEEGGNAFLDYAVPQAIIKFKQGFGRLIRKETDRGCIVCLDERIIKKAYGQKFLKSLPPCQFLYDKWEKIAVEMKNFYGAYRS